MPELVPAGIGNWLKALPNASFITAFLALGFFTSARVAVQVSTGINALPRGQRNAGSALGLTPVQTYRYVRVADGVPYHHSVAHQRVCSDHQEQLGGVDHRPGRADCGDLLDA